MLVVTENGHYLNTVVDRSDPSWVLARSQDRASVEHLVERLGDHWAYSGLEGRALELVDEPTWDYQFRVRLTRAEWAEYLGLEAFDASADRLKPAVARARGLDHPVSQLVEHAFYYMSENRPDGSRPGWMTGEPKR